MDIHGAQVLERSALQGRRNGAIRPPAYGPRALCMRKIRHKLTCPENGATTPSSLRRRPWVVVFDHSIGVAARTRLISWPSEESTQNLRSPSLFASGARACNGRSASHAPSISVAGATLAWSTEHGFSGVIAPTIWKYPSPANAYTKHNSDMERSPLIEVGDEGQGLFGLVPLYS